MPITINSNIAATKVQRRLNATTASLRQSYARLSSGLRINKASDDAAGMAVASSLKTDALVFSQGVRNINDGISLLNIAEGAVDELQNITVRQIELAQQAANGVMSTNQRVALHDEADSLRLEFNRIAATAEFNGRKLIDGTLTDSAVQGGYGANAKVAIALGYELGRNVGNGFLNTGPTWISSFAPIVLASGDFDGDGNVDVVGSDYPAGLVRVLVGNGDGTFKTGASFTAASYFDVMETADFNNDGKLDFIAAGSAGQQLFVFAGNGDGTFLAPVSSPSLMGPTERVSDIDIADVDNDGDNDIAIHSYSGVTHRSVIGINNGSGLFSTTQEIATASATSFTTDLADFNGDGILDLLGKVQAGSLRMLFGNGDGTFLAPVSASISGVSSDFRAGDFNEDGINDIAYFGGSGASIVLGNGNGTFRASRSYAGLNPNLNGDNPMLDMNGDGHLDFVGADGSMLLGNGDGSFKAGISYNAFLPLIVDDVNNDFVPDCIAPDSTTGLGVMVYTQTLTKTPTAASLNLRTQSGARDALDLLDVQLDRVINELGKIGSFSSRLSAATNTLAIGRENYTAAYGQIEDVDVADESAQLIRESILQNAGAAVLAQANIEPQLALRLLGIPG